MGERMSNDISVHTGDDNVFVDLGFEAPDEELAKAQLTSHIRRIVKARRLTQKAAAEIMEIDQPKVSALMNGRLANFSSDRLMRLLTALGQDVEISVKSTKKDRAKGHIRVVADAAD